jgi:hypothetical protein
MDGKDVLKRIDLMAQEQLSMQKEIDTLNKNIERKDEILFGLSEIIINTENIELIKKMEIVMAKANGLMK